MHFGPPRVVSRPLSRDPKASDTPSMTMVISIMTSSMADRVSMTGYKKELQRSARSKVHWSTCCISRLSNRSCVTVALVSLESTVTFYVVKLLVLFSKSK